MKSMVDSAQFRAALERVSKATEKASLPVLTEVRVEFTPDTCTLMATDLNQWITAECAAQGDTFFLTFSDTKAVLKAAKYFSGPLSVELCAAENPKDCSVCLRTGDKGLEQRVADEPDFPQPPALDATEEYAVNAGTLYRRFERVKYAIFSGTSRPEYTGVKFFDSSLLTIDGYRVALNTDPSLTVGRRPFLMPEKAMSLLSIFGENDITLMVGERCALFSGGGLTLRTRLLDGIGFDPKGVIPTSFAEEYTVGVKDLTSALRYLDALAKGNSVRVAAFDSGVLTMETPDGEYRATVPIEGKSSVRFGFQIRYLLEGLGQFKGETRVTFKVNGPISPIILTAGGADLALVLPFRIKEAAKAA